MSTTKKSETPTVPKIPGLHYEYEPLAPGECPDEPELASRVRYARAKKVARWLIFWAGLLAAAVYLDGILSK